MKRVAFVALACVACKGSTATTEAAAPSASASAAPSATAVATPSAVTTASVAASATVSAPPPPSVGSLRPKPPAGACGCAQIKVGDVYPHQNGHAMQFHDRDAKVLSVDPSSCSATVKDIASGTTRTERCDSGFFDEPRINPAG